MSKELYRALSPKLAATLAGIVGSTSLAARIILGDAPSEDISALAAAAEADDMAPYRENSTAAHSAEAGHLRLLSLLFAQVATPLVPAQSAASHLSKSHEVCEAVGGTDGQFGELVIIEEWADEA